MSDRGCHVMDLFVHKCYHTDHPVVSDGMDTSPDIIV